MRDALVAFLAAGTALLQSMTEKCKVVYRVAGLLGRWAGHCLRFSAATVVGRCKCVPYEN